MTGRTSFTGNDPGHSLPIFDRIAPAPSPALIAARIEQHSGPGDVVADLFGRGAWVARTAVDLQRRGVSLESSPLTRMLAEVLRNGRLERKIPFAQPVEMNGPVVVATE